MSNMTTAANFKMRADAIIVAVVKVMTLSSPFNQREFPFLDKSGILFSPIQRCLQPLYFSLCSPPTTSKLPFCAGVQFSRDSTIEQKYKQKILQREIKIISYKGCEYSNCK